MKRRSTDEPQRVVLTRSRRRQLTIEEAVSPHNASIETVETVETTSSTFALAPTSPTTAPSTTVSTPLTVTTTTSAIPTVTETQVRYYRLLASHLIRSTLSGTLTDAIKVAADHFGIQGQESTPGLLSIYQRLNTGASHYDTPNPPANTGVTLFDLQESVRGGKGLVRIWGQRGTLHLYDRRDWPVVCAASGEKVIGWRMASVKGGNVTGRDSSKELGEARKRVRDLLSQGETVSKAIFDSLGYPPKLSYSVFMCATLEGHGSRGLDEGGSVMLPREVVAPAAKVPWTTPTHAEALLIAARRYFKTYGPAKEEDFRYWMNLSAAESKSTISTLRESNELVRVDVQPTTNPPPPPNPKPRKKPEEYFITATGLSTLTTNPPDPTTWPPRLLYRFDPLLLAHADKSIWIPPHLKHRIWTTNALILPTVLVEGKVCGTWRVERTKTGGMEVWVEIFEGFEGCVTERVREGLRRQAVGVGTFWGCDVERVVFE